MFDTGPLSALLSGMQSQQTPAAPVVQPPPPGPLSNIGALLTGGSDFGSILQKIGGGMANMGPTGGDRYLAFAQGFGGSQQFTTQQQKEAADRAAAAAKAKADQDMAMARLLQDQSQHAATLGQSQSQFDARMSQDQSQFDANMTLEEQRERRAQMVADAATKKTAAETVRLARKEDIDPTIMLRIDEAAKKVAENVYDPKEKQAVYEAERDRLIKQVQAQDISQGPGVTEAKAQVPTASNEAGQKLVLSPDGNSWIPAQ